MAGRGSRVNRPVRRHLTTRGEGRSTVAASRPQPAQVRVRTRNPPPGGSRGALECLACAPCQARGDRPGVQERQAKLERGLMAGPQGRPPRTGPCGGNINNSSPLTRLSRGTSLPSEAPKGFVPRRLAPSDCLAASSACRAAALALAAVPNPEGTPESLRGGPPRDTPTVGVVDGARRRLRFVRLLSGASAAPRHTRPRRRHPARPPRVRRHAETRAAGSEPLISLPIAVHPSKPSSESQSCTSSGASSPVPQQLR